MGNRPPAGTSLAHRPFFQTVPAPPPHRNMILTSQEYPSPKLEEGELSTAEDANELTRGSGVVGRRSHAVNDTHSFSTPSYCHTPTPPEEGTVEPLDLSSVAARLSQLPSRPRRGGRRVQRDVQRVRNHNHLSRNRPSSEKRRQERSRRNDRQNQGHQPSLRSELPRHLIQGDKYRPPEDQSLDTRSSKGARHGKGNPGELRARIGFETSRLCPVLSQFYPVPPQEQPPQLRAVSSTSQQPRDQRANNKRRVRWERANARARQETSSSRLDEYHEGDRRSTRDEESARSVINSLLYRQNRAEYYDRRRARSLRRVDEDQRYEDASGSQESSLSTEQRHYRIPAPVGADRDEYRRQHSRIEVDPEAGSTQFGTPGPNYTTVTTPRYRTPPSRYDWQELGVSAAISATTPSLTSSTSVSSFVSMSPSLSDLPSMVAVGPSDEQKPRSGGPPSLEVDTLAALRQAALATKKSSVKRTGSISCEKSLPIQQRPPLRCRPMVGAVGGTGPPRLGSVGQMETLSQLAKNAPFGQSFPSAPPSTPHFAQTWQQQPPPWQQRGPLSAPPGDLHCLVPNARPLPWPNAMSPTLLTAFNSPPPGHCRASAHQPMFQPPPLSEFSTWSPTPQQIGCGQQDGLLPAGWAMSGTVSQAQPLRFDSLLLSPPLRPPRPHKQQQEQRRGDGLFCASMVLEEESCVLSDIDSDSEHDSDDEEVSSDDEESRGSFCIPPSRKRGYSESASTSGGKKRRRWEEHAVELHDIMFRFKSSTTRLRSATHVEHSDILPGVLEDEDDSHLDMALAHPLGSQIEHMKTQIDELEAKRRARRLSKMEQHKQDEVAC